MATTEGRAGSTTRVNSLNEDTEKAAAAADIVSKDSAPTDAVPTPYVSPKGLKKWAIVICVCGAMFFDIFTACAAIVALPTIGEDLDFGPGTVTWILTGYTLTFGAFQVPSGRLSDIYHPKPIFCLGFLFVGIFSILCAVSVHPIMLIIFRAMAGLAAAMTIPSAISILVTTFPDPKEKNDLLGIFGAMGAIGNCCGIIIGGVLSGTVSWRWVFYLIAIVVIPFAVASLFLIPGSIKLVSSQETKRNLDLPGISILVAALILFVYGISDGNTEGWSTPQIITTIVLSVFLFVVFFVVERYTKDAALPSSTWSNTNFTPMFFYAWSVYWFFFVMEFQLIEVFQDLWKWSPLSAAVHAIPTGVTAGISSWATGQYGHLVPRKVLLVFGQLFMITGSILFALAKEPSDYWPYIFPGMVVGMTGLGWAYVGSNITTMVGARKGEEGVVGAVLYTSYQLGSTIGLAVSAAVTVGVNIKLPSDPLSQHQGYAASFWSLVAMHGIMALISVAFVRN